MANLSNPSTQLDQFFKQIGRTSAQVAPVAAVQAQLFANMADTFAAIGRDPAALAATIEKSPITEAVSIQSFRIQRPFLRDFTDLSARLRPAAAILPTALPPLNAALAVGTPVLRRSVILNQNTTKVFNALDDLANDPNTLLALKDLSQLTRSGAPLFQYISPMQTVCNYATYFFNALGSHISEGVITGTAERVLLKAGNDWQDDVAYNSFGARPSDLPPNVDPIGAKVGPNDEPAYVLHGQPYTPAIDAQGNADCAKGQFGYESGPLLDNPGRYKPVNGSKSPPGPPPDGQTYNAWARDHGGSGHVVVADNPPFLYGRNFTSLGNLSQVDSALRKDGITP